MNPPIWTMALVLAIVAPNLAGPNLVGADTVVQSWIQLGPGSSPESPARGVYGDQPASMTPTILARAIVTDHTAGCPGLVVDGRLAMKMTMRFNGGQLTHTPGSPGFSNAERGGYPTFFVSAEATAPAVFPDGTAKATIAWGLCEAVVPSGHRTARIGDAVLKLPVAAPKRIVLIGDTGCRMARAAQQKCHDPADFPFAAVAAQAAKTKPDLIVHAGDYFYRDSDCEVPASGQSAAHPYAEGCDNPASSAYETWGDTFDSWNADLFYPGRKLLDAAPWVMIRGNHESCGRGARGWFALLDPRPFDMANVTCAGGSVAGAVAGDKPVYSADFSPGYLVPAGKVNFLVHDTSYANDIAVDATMARNYDLDLTALLTAMPTNAVTILVTHKPAYGMIGGSTASSGNQTEQFTFSGNASSHSVFAGGMPASVAFLLAGHIHQFEYVSFADRVHYAPQLVTGMGGDKLDRTVNPDGHSTEYAYRSKPFTVHNAVKSTTETMVTHAFSRAEFGFAVLDRRRNGYAVSVRRVDGTKAGKCTITFRPRDIVCWR